MKLRISLLSLLCVWMLIGCVDDYQDANPPRPLDGPAIFSINPSSETVVAGGSVAVTANVVDAPGGIASVAATAVDEDGDEVGSFTVTNARTGETEGLIELQFTAPDGYVGEVTISVTVTDAQTPPKTSAPATTTIEVI